MGNAQDPEKGCYGDRAICQGSQAHFWGGAWLLAATGSDNPTMLADVLDTFINDEEVCKALIENEAQFTNNQAVNAAYHHRQVCICLSKSIIKGVTAGSVKG